MAKAINVKIKKEKIVAALQAKLIENEENIAFNNKADENHKKAMADYYELLVKKFIGKVKPSDVNTRWNGRVEFTYEFTDKDNVPEAPKPEDYKRTLGNWELEEIQGAIRILEMSEEEMVNASTMKSISQYL